VLLVERAFNLLLQGSTDVTALVSNRIYSGFAPQTVTLPALTHRVESRGHIYALQGSCGLRESRFRLFSAARQYDEAKALDEAVRMSIDGYRGIVSDSASPPDTLQIQFIRCVFSHDSYEDGNLTSSGSKVFEIVTDYEVTAHEEVPD